MTFPGGGGVTSLPVMAGRVAGKAKVSSSLNHSSSNVTLHPFQGSEVLNGLGDERVKLEEKRPRPESSNFKMTQEKCFDLCKISWACHQKPGEKF